MTRTATPRGGAPHCPSHRITWRARALVLGGLTLAAVYTAAAVALGAGGNHIGVLWVIAIVWTVAASLAGALWRGLRHGDWTAFSNYELPEDDDEMDEWLSRTGRYSSHRDLEDQLLHEDDHLR